MKRLLLSIGVAVMAVASVFAETKTVTLTKGKWQKINSADAFSTTVPIYLTATVDEVNFNAYATASGSTAAQFSLRGSKECWFTNSTAPENATLSSVKFNLNYADGEIVVYYSNSPMDRPNSMNSLFTKYVENGDVTLDFTGLNAKYFMIYNRTATNCQFNYPITVTFDIAEAKPVEPLQAPSICGPDGALVGGEVLDQGTGIFFEHNNDKGSVWYSTSTDNGATWSEYTEAEEWTGTKVQGNPGDRFGIRAFVKSDVEAENSPITEVFVTVAEKWATPSLQIGENILEGEYFSLEMTAGDKITVINPTTDGAIHIECGEDYLDGKIGENFVYTVPEELEFEGWPLQFYASVRGEGKSSSTSVYLEIPSIKLKAPRIEDDYGKLLKRGVPVASGSYVFFNNPNSKGTVYAATCVDGVWGTYTEIAPEDGLQIFGLPGTAIEIAAYVKGDNLSADSETSVAQVTFMEEWEMPTFIFKGDSYTGTDSSVEQAEAGDVLTVVNPNPEGMLFIYADGETIQCEPGINYQHTLVANAEGWMLEAKVVGNEKSDSPVAAFYIAKIVDGTNAIEAIEAMGGKAIYYNLKGQRISKPERGCYVVVIGGKANKVIK